MAALEGGLTFQKGLGAVHALSHPLGGLKQVSLHHGTLNAVLLPYVLEFNGSHSEAKYKTIRQRLGLEEGEALLTYIRGLNARLGMPTTLAEMGVPQDARGDRQGRRGGSLFGDQSAPGHGGGLSHDPGECLWRETLTKQHPCARSYTGFN